MEMIMALSFAQPQAHDPAHPSTALGVDFSEVSRTFTTKKESRKRLRMSQDNSCFALI